MAVPLQTVSAAASRPVMGIVQDSLLGSALLTSKGVFIDRVHMYRFVAWIRPVAPVRLPPPAVTFPVEMWTGAQLFSMLLPLGVTVARGGGGIVPDVTDVLIRDGHLLYGRLTKATLGTAANGLIDVLARDFGSRTTIDFMSNVQRVVNAWLMGEGFGVKISDCVISDDGIDKVDACVNHATDNATAVLEADLPESMASLREGTVVSILSKLLMQTGAIARSNMEKRNSIAAMVDCGAKGNPINTSQIAGCVGQQSVEGRRIVTESSSRTLSCYAQHDVRLGCNGFVRNSYALGLHPTEFFFHSMGGREGLVDTAVKTAVTGYIQRRLVKMMEVRDAVEY